ncbi:MAG: VCBS repeat-containing protein [Deltaproteobacteria bacterium]|nr:VCBS repeat-containing protein [Deltaproteobacteria bacterium]
MGAFRLAVLGWTMVMPSLVLAQVGGVFDAADNSNSLDGKPAAIVVADINNDNHLDVVTANADTASVSVITGDGGGFMGWWGRYDAGSVPMGLAVARFDDDGNPDAVVSNGNMSALTYLKGFGEGTFEVTGDPIMLPGVCSLDPAQACNSDLPQAEDECTAAEKGECTAVAGPGAIATADLNGDGLADLAVASAGNSEGDAKVSILFGRGDGTFTAVAPMITGTNSPSTPSTAGVLITDVNSDSRPDVVAANSGSSNVSVFLGDGAGGFGARIDSSVGVAPTAVAAADINEDGHPDLTISMLDGILVLTGDGQGHFTAGASAGAGNTPNGVVLTDVDKDGHVDALVSNNRSSDISVLRGNGLGGFGPARSFVADEEPLVIAAGDLDEDGFPDAVVGARNYQNAFYLPVLLNHGAGRLLAVEDLLIGQAVAATAAGDVNNDALPDLAVIFGSGADSRAQVFLAGSDGGFVVTTPVATGEYPNALALADFNRDDKLDLVTTNNHSDNVSVLLGHGDGTFDAARSSATEPKPLACAVGDFDNNRIPDLAVASTGEPGAVSILLGNGDGTLHSAATVTVQNTPLALAVGHFDGDANDDVLVANFGSNNISILLGNGDGTFRTSDPLYVGRGPASIAVLDLNRDGADDFAVALANEPQLNVAVYAGSAGGVTFWLSIPAGDTPSAIVARDFDGNGRPDVVVSNQVSNNITVLVGTNSNRLSRLGSVTVSRQPKTIAAADFNGDGRYDVATSNYAQTSMNVSVVNNSGAAAVLRADGNGDGRRGAADLVALQRQLADSDTGRPEDAGGGSFAAAPGVDANGDGLITLQDARATVTRIFLGS